MTDPTSTDAARAERIAALQRRRAGSAPKNGSTPRKKHPAAATRWLLAGLSVMSFFTIGGAVAVADKTPVVVAASPAPTTPTTSAPPIFVPTYVPTAPDPTPARPVPAAPTTSPAPRPHTTTRAS